MESLEARMVRFIRTRQLLPNGATILVAYSGGPDSTFLLHALSAARDSLNVQLVAAHLNHGLRGEKASQDENHCRRVCKELGILLETGQAHLSGRLGEAKARGVEELARTTRRNFLIETAARLGCGRIATGHTLDDRVESLLMNAVRGTGLAGLTGIRASSLPFVRPLLGIRRSELLAWLVEHKVEWITDETNFELGPLRNRVRHLLLPSLELDIAAGATEALARLADLAEQVHDYFCKQALEALAQCSQRQGNDLLLQLEPFGRLDPALRGEVLRQALLELAPDLRDLAQAHIYQLEALTRSEGSSKGLQLPTVPEVFIYKEYSQLRLTLTPASEVQPVAVQLPLPGQVDLPERGIRVVISLLDKEHWPSEPASKCLYMAASKLSQPLVLRSPLEGDRFIPLGLGAEKRVARYLLDARIPASERAKALLVCDTEGILGILGLRPAERARDALKADLVVEIRIVSLANSSEE